MASDDSANQTVTKVYSAWIKSCLPSCSVGTTSLKEDLRDGQVLCQLIEKLTGCNLPPCSSLELETYEAKHQNVQQVLNFMQRKGIEIKSSCAEDVVKGDLKALLDLLWLVILHFEVHTTSRAAYQRSVSMGKRFLLEWIARELPDVIIEPKGHFVECFQNGFLLREVVSKYCTVEGVNTQGLNVDDLKAVLETAECHLGVPSSITSAPAVLDGVVDEYSLLIYLAVLRRKISEKRGEDAYKGGGSPVKQRAPQTPDNGTSTPVRSLYVLMTPPTVNGDAGSPLSPTTLQNLVEQQAKSHEAIQALQDKLQSVTYQPLTPKLQKQLFPRTPLAEMPPVLGIAQPPSQQRNSNSTDCNGNVLSSGVDEAFSLCSNNDKLYGSVDRRFLEFMLDAVHKGYVSPDIASSKTLLDGEGKEITTRQVKTSEEAKTSKDSPGTTSNDKKNSETEKGMVSGDCESKENTPQDDFNKSLLIKDITSAEEAINSQINGAVSQHDIHKSSETGNIITKHKDMTSEAGSEGREIADEMTPKSAKRVQFLGLDTVFPSQEEDESSILSNSSLTPIGSRNALDVSVCISENDTNASDAAELKNTEISTAPSSDKKETGTWASLDPPCSNSKADDGASVNDQSENTPDDRSGVERDTDSVISPVEYSFDEENDQFMMYLNSIEQTALKFKLQVEQAKIDTLQVLKQRLELAYEGTPLEEIPSKVHQRLQETIAQIATEEVDKYEGLLHTGDDIDEEGAIIQQMRNELDSVAEENYNLQKELEDLKRYEREYHALNDKINSMEESIASMKHEYTTKNGESEFLAERIEILEKEILAMRLEYEGQIRELQNENIELQKECVELDNENRMLGEEVNNLRGYDPDGIVHENVEYEERNANEYEEVNNDCFRDEVSVPSIELEAFENRVIELERHNKAFRTAANADQAMVTCLESKINDMDQSLKLSQENSSNLLSELHEAQRVNSSDRAKISSYKEEVDALKRENNLMKSNLELAERELNYQREKTSTSTKPKYLPTRNKREIWKEIHELETILKDAHREKRTIEKKYLAFQQGNSELNKSSNSINSRTSSSPTLLTPPPVSVPTTQGWSDTGNATLPVSPGRRRTTSLLERVNSLLEKASMPNGVKREISLANGLDANGRSQSKPTRAAISSSLPRNIGSGLSGELVSLRQHVGSLEAEKASILRELSSIRTPKKENES